jgi:hypothetical protein
LLYDPSADRGLEKRGRFVTKKIAVLAVISLVAGSFAFAAPKRVDQMKAAKMRNKAKVKAVQRGPNVVGTITYDTGVPGAGFHPGPKTNAGNRFNSDMGGPLLMTGQLTMIAFFPSTTAGFVTAFGPPDGAGNAVVLSSIAVSGAVPSAFNTVSGLNIAVGPDFLAGAWEVHPTLQQGMDNMSVGGQGFHAFDVFTMFSVGVATQFAPIPGQNALVRASGNILVPVELMNFQVK